MCPSPSPNSAGRGLWLWRLGLGASPVLSGWDNTPAWDNTDALAGVARRLGCYITRA